MWLYVILGNILALFSVRLHVVVMERKLTGTQGVFLFYLKACLRSRVISGSLSSTIGEHSHDLNVCLSPRFYFCVSLLPTVSFLGRQHWSEVRTSQAYIQTVRVSSTGPQIRLQPLPPVLHDADRCVLSSSNTFKPMQSFLMFPNMVDNQCSLFRYNWPLPSTVLDSCP